MLRTLILALLLLLLNTSQAIAQATPTPPDPTPFTPSWGPVVLPVSTPCAITLRRQSQDIQQQTCAATAMIITLTASAVCPLPDTTFAAIVLHADANGVPAGVDIQPVGESPIPCAFSEVTLNVVPPPGAPMVMATPPSVIVGTPVAIDTPSPIVVTTATPMPTTGP